MTLDTCSGASTDTMPPTRPSVPRTARFTRFSPPTTTRFLDRTTRVTTPVFPRSFPELRYTVSPDTTFHRGRGAGGADLITRSNPRRT